MVLLLKRVYQGYFYAMNELADPRALEYPLMASLFPTILILIVFFKFVCHWGPKYMENRPPFQIKKIVMAYNVIQILINIYILINVVSEVHRMDWNCSPIDYTENYLSRKMINCVYYYYMLKIFDLLDTVFFVLRKKYSHLSFLHLYHHFGMVMIGWFGVKFFAGGHTYFVGLSNCPVHVLLYSYYLLTAYNSKYGNLLWLKKFITQCQLFQFGFNLFMYGKLLFQPDCAYPKFVSFFLVPQNLFMITLFGDFYIRTYILNTKKRSNLNINNNDSNNNNN